MFFVKYTSVFLYKSSLVKFEFCESCVLKYLNINVDSQCVFITSKVAYVYKIRLLKLLLSIHKIIEIIIT